MSIWGTIGSCALLLVILLGPPAFLVLRDAWKDATRDVMDSESEGRWSTFAEQERWGR